MSTYTDHRGRVWPIVTVTAYQREPEFWWEYVRLLDNLADSYDQCGMELSAFNTRMDAQDIRAVIQNA